MDSSKNTRTYEMSLPTKLADQLDKLYQTLRVSPGEAMGRALQLLSHAVYAYKVTMVKDHNSRDIIVK